jgi:hypothetical protein
MKNRTLKCILTGILLMSVVGCGAKAPAAETPENADVQQTQEAADDAAAATTKNEAGQNEESADSTTDAKIGDEEDRKLSDEDFYAEILDTHYYNLVSQKEYDDSYYVPGAMMTYAYSKDGYDKAGALDYSGYGFEDLDGDGFNELIIGNLSDDPKLDKMIYAIYTRNNNVPYCVLSSTDYTHYYLCSGKFIGYEQNAGSKMFSEYGLYEFTDANPWTKLVTLVESDKGDNDSVVWTKTDVSGKELSISENEAEKSIAEYKDRRIAPALTAFSAYEPKNPEDYYDGNAYSTFGSGYNSWNEAYLAYLDESMPEEISDMSFALIYVDDDDVPELVVDTGFEAGGCQILSYYDGTVRVLQTSRLYFTYIEKSGLLCNSEGHMGYYYDYVLKLDKGQWKNELLGDYYELDENATEDMYNEETGRFRTLHYTIDGEETDEETYMVRLREAYDLDKGKEPLSYLRIDDLKSFLTTGKYVSDGHRYELFVEDCTWEEAAKKCEEKGGYLACLTTDEEFKIVDDLIRSEGKENNVFYIGANRVDKFGYHWTDPNLTQTECTGEGYWKHWLDGMPSYSDKLPDGTEIDEEYVEYFYRKSEDKFYMNDIPNDVIGYYPSYKGRMGYICEYN